MQGGPLSGGRGEKGLRDEHGGRLFVVEHLHVAPLGVGDLAWAAASSARTSHQLGEVCAEAAAHGEAVGVVLPHPVLEGGVYLPQPPLGLLSFA